MTRSGAIAAGSIIDGKAVIVIRISEDLVGRGMSAKDIAKLMGTLLGGSGGGSLTFAQAGGKNIDKLRESLDLLYKYAREKLGE